jgi:sirohydrochlorin ferrochelatase
MNEPEPPTLVAAAHGTDDVNGLAELRRLTNIVRTSLPDVEVVLCFVDVAEPTLEQTLATVIGPAVIVPLLLSTGHHVKVDIPQAAQGRPGTVITAPIGPDERISRAVQQRLEQARVAYAAARSAGGGVTDEDLADYEREPLPRGPIVLVSAGSADPQARVELGEVAAHLRQWNSWPVTIAPLTGPDVLSHARGETQVANYLLASGFFYNKVRVQAEGLVLGAPIGAHPLVAQVIVERYAAGTQALAAASQRSDKDGPVDL